MKHTTRPGRRGVVSTPEPHEDRRGWMMFACSGPLQLHALQVDQIDPHDIAHGLSGINRWNGQSRVPLSVLWHSLMVAGLCRSTPMVSLGSDEADDRMRQRFVTEALFHDAAEAYVGDWIRPIQWALSWKALALRDRIQATCFAAAGLEKSHGDLNPVVRDADNLMLRWEMQSEWGYGLTASWYEPLTPDERKQVETVLEIVGPPPQTTETRRASQEVFLRCAEGALPAEAPMRRHLQPGTKS